jgi:hypothetical protein
VRDDGVVVAVGSFYPSGPVAELAETLRHLPVALPRCRPGCANAGDWVH